MYGAFLTLHLVGLAMGLGTAIFMAVLGARTRKQGEQALMQVMPAAMGTSGLLGDLGTALLLLSGLGMYWINPGWADGPWFWSKMGLVALLVGLVVVMRVHHRKIFKQGKVALMQRLPVIGNGILLTALAITIVAVQHFRP